MKSHLIFVGLLFWLAGMFVTKAQFAAGLGTNRVVRIVSLEALQANAISPGTMAGFQIEETQTDIEKEQANARTKAWIYLNNKKYDELDALAESYRVSKKSSPIGNWMLLSVYSGIDGEILGCRSTEQQWNDLQKLIEAWVAAKPGSATARVAQSRFWINYAWYARGGGYSDSVSEQSWKDFTERLNKASTLLVQAQQIQEKCPVYWSTAQQIGLGLGVGKANYDHLFQQARTNVIGYDSIYAARATYLLPRWYGDEGEWQKDLAHWADLCGGEEGDVLYARVVWWMAGMRDTRDSLKNHSLSWGRVEKGLNVLEKRYPDNLTVISVHAKLAEMAGKPEVAHDYMLKTRGKVDSAVWGSNEEFTQTYQLTLRAKP
jgi:hypothetical protein